MSFFRLPMARRIRAIPYYEDVYGPVNSEEHTCDRPDVCESESDSDGDRKDSPSNGSISLDTFSLTPRITREDGRSDRVGHSTIGKPRKLRRVSRADIQSAAGESSFLGGASQSQKSDVDDQRHYKIHPERDNKHSLPVIDTPRSIMSQTLGVFGTPIHIGGGQNHGDEGDDSMAELLKSGRVDASDDMFATLEEDGASATSGEPHEPATAVNTGKAKDKDQLRKRTPMAVAKTILRRRKTRSELKSSTPMQRPATRGLIKQQLADADLARKAARRMTRSKGTAAKKVLKVSKPLTKKRSSRKTGTTGVKQRTLTRKNQRVKVDVKVNPMSKSRKTGDELRVMVLVNNKGVNANEYRMVD